MLRPGPHWLRLATLVAAALVLASCAPAASPSPVVGPSSAAPSASSEPASPEPRTVGSPSPVELPPLAPSGSLPVRESASDVGFALVPGPRGMVYVLVSQPTGAVIALLGGGGRPRPGWPIEIADTHPCGTLLVAGDGSVRVACQSDERIGGSEPPVVLFAFETSGRLRAGWPISLACCERGSFVGRVNDGELAIHSRRVSDGQREDRVVTVAADGAIHGGAPVASDNCCLATSVVGPDGIAYLVRYDLGTADRPSLASSALTAIGAAGVVEGFPVSFDGILSLPAFDAEGRLYLTRANVKSDSSFLGPAETLVLAPDGRLLDGGSGKLDLVATDLCVGVEGSCAIPAAPLVGADGTSIVVEAAFDGTRAIAVSAAGTILSGWPYASDAAHQSRGFCPAPEVCEGYALAAPAIGPDNALYVINRAARSTVGSSLLAVGTDGQVRDGWPVELTRPGGEFWWVVVGDDGTAYALAVEPEGSGAFSATVLAIAPDSTVMFSTAVVEP